MKYDVEERLDSGSMELCLCGCASIHRTDDLYPLIGLLQSAGGSFLRSRGSGITDVPQWEKVTEPLAWTGANGRVTLENYCHPLLARSDFEPIGLRRFPAACTVFYWPAAGRVVFSQSGNPDDRENLDDMACGQLALGRLLYPVLRPRLAFVDEVSDMLDEEKVLHTPLEDSVRTGELPYLFWATFLGPAYVARCDRDFLLEAPGRAKSELGDGGILYVTTKSYYRWWSKGSGKIERYFQNVLPKVIVYNTDRLFAGDDIGTME